MSDMLSSQVAGHMNPSSLYNDRQGDAEDKDTVDYGIQQAAVLDDKITPRDEYEDDTIIRIENETNSDK